MKQLKYNFKSVYSLFLMLFATLFGVLLDSLYGVHPHNYTLAL